MSGTVNLNALAEEARKLQALLSDRQPGLMSWNGAVKDRLQGLSDLIANAGITPTPCKPIERERDRLRELIEEIADMDLGDPEMEHREIIARCRKEVESWEDAV